MSQGQDGIAARFVANAPHTWEAKAFLASGKTTSDTPRVDLTSSYLIVGMRPSIVVVPPGSPGSTVAVVGTLVAPTLEDIEMSLDINSGTLITSASGQSTLAGDKDGSFVSLPSVDTSNGVRLMNLRMDGDNPSLKFTFRWVRGPTIYFDAIVRVALFAARIPKK